MVNCLTPARSVRKEISGRNITAVPATFGRTIATFLPFSTGVGLVVVVGVGTI